MSLDDLITEAGSDRTRDLDRMSAIQIVDAMNAEDAGVAAAVAAERAPIAAAIDLLAARLGAGGRLIYVGAGTSGRLGVLDASECPPTFHTEPEQVVGIIAGGPEALTRAAEGAEDRAEAARADLAAIALAAGDVVVGVAASGRTPYVVAALEAARAVGAATVAVCCNRDAPVAAAADTAITPVVGPEVIAGSTRLKAGTATKMVLNMLSTGAMVRLGKVHGNLMVDLRTTSRKLEVRARRIVAELVGCASEEAERLIAAADGEVKTAVVCGCCGVAPAEARIRLNAAGGRLRQALEA